MSKRTNTEYVASPAIAPAPSAARRVGRSENRTPDVAVSRVAAEAARDEAEHAEYDAIMEFERIAAANAVRASGGRRGLPANW